MKSRTKEYQAWNSMKQRCHNNSNPSYKNYGARGIVVCDRWRASFDDFITDMGPCAAGLSLERSNNFLGYYPGNCYWATRSEQNINKRNNFMVTYLGETLTFKEWCDRLYFKDNLGVTDHAVYCRITKSKWSVEKAFTAHAKSATTYKVFGKPMSILEIAETYNLSRETVTSRLASGCVDAALIAPVVVNKFTVGGVTKTVKEWALECGQSEPTTRKWLLSGKPLNSLSSRAPIEFKGQTMTLINWSILWGLDRKKLSYLRKRRGLSMQEIFEEYVNGRN